MRRRWPAVIRRRQRLSSCKVRHEHGDYIELAWDQEHYTYQLYGSDTLASAAAALANSINTFSQTMQAAANGAAITLTLTNSSTGSNGNRIGVYGNVYSAPPGAPTESWQPGWQLLSGGVSPSQWQINLDFSSISGLECNRRHGARTHERRAQDALDLGRGFAGRRISRAASLR